MSQEKIVRSTALIAFFTLVSKVMGFLRESLMANAFGIGMETDAYNAAFTATVVIMGVIGLGLNTTLVPVFSEITGRYGMPGRRRFFNNMMTTTFVGCFIISVLFFIFSPTIISLVAMGFEGEQLALAIHLNRIALPIIILLGFTHVLMGYLQSLEIFGPYALMGIPYNLVFILYLALAKTPAIASFMVVTVLAALMQVLIQVPAVAHTGVRLKPHINLKDPYMKKVGGLIVPILISSTIQQLNIIIDKNLASLVGVGVMSALNYATKLNELVISVFIMAISTVVFPMMAEAFLKNDTEGTHAILAKAINLVMLITIPATIGLIVLSRPIVFVAFERGAFNTDATTLTSGALVFYAIGLMTNALNMVLNRVYYSYRNTKTPMLIGILMVAVNLIANLLLMKPMGHKGLALATSISNMMGTVLLSYWLRNYLSMINVKRLAQSFFKMAIAASVMGVAVYLFYYPLVSMLGTRKLIATVMLMASMFIGAAVYGLLCWIFRVPELTVLLKKIRAKFAR